MQKFTQLAFGLVLVGAAGCQTTAHSPVTNTPHGEVLKIETTDDNDSAQPRSENQKATAEAIGAAKAKPPTDAAGLARLAHLYLLANNLKQANATANKALAIDFRDREAKLVVAYVAYRQERYSYASQVLKTLGGEAAPEAEVVNLMALVAMKSGDENEALRLAEAACLKDKNAVAPRLNAGILHLRQREYQAAEKFLKDAQRIDPDNNDVLLHLAVALAALGRPADAEKLYAQVRDNGGDTAMALFNEATMYARAHKIDKAIKTYEAYVKRVKGLPGRQDEAMAAISDLKMERAAHGKVSDEKIGDLADDASSDEPVAFDEDTGPGSVAVTSMGVMGDSSN